LLRDRLLAGLRARIDGVEVNGALAPRLSGNLHVSIAGVEAKTLILSLGGRIALSSGAACAEATGKGSHVLRAMGLPDERVYTALRFGLGRYNTDAEVDEVVDALVQAVSAARARAASALRQHGGTSDFGGLEGTDRPQKPTTQIACLSHAAVTECRLLQAAEADALDDRRARSFHRVFHSFCGRARRQGTDR